uniref:Transmembrane protein n=1 Tax=Fagus sylvatica TaxID=28930 RepID=A0A2N9IQH7_FAGSY
MGLGVSSGAGLVDFVLGCGFCVVGLARGGRGRLRDVSWWVCGVARSGGRGCLVDPVVGLWGGSRLDFSGVSLLCLEMFNEESWLLAVVSNVRLGLVLGTSGGGAGYL